MGQVGRRRIVALGMVVVAALGAASCSSDAQESPAPDSSSTSIADAGASTSTTMEEPADPNAGLLGLVSPVLRGDYVVEPPSLIEPEGGGAVVDLRDPATAQPLFDLSDVPGELFGVFSDWSMTDSGLAALVYVAEQPDEGLRAGATEIGLLVRSLDSGEGRQDREVLRVLDPEELGPDEAARRSELVRVYQAGERLAVVDFAEASYWVIEPDGSVRAGELSNPVSIENCNLPDAPRPAGNDCLDDNDITDRGRGILTSLQTDSNNLLLVNQNRASSGTVPLLRIDLETGQTTGPDTWDVASGLLSTGGPPTCDGTEVCIAPATGKRRSDRVEVMNRFDPLTLEAELVPVPAGLVGLSPYLFGGRLLWIGGPTVMTDLNGNEEVWRLGETASVRANPLASNVLVAANSDGQAFFVDPETGQEVAEIDDLASLDDIVSFNDRWLLYRSAGMLTFTAVP